MSASGTFIQYWKNWYGVVLSAASQTVSPSDLLNFLPSERSSSGQVRACACLPSAFLIRSTPASRFPHWSEPPIWISTAWFLDRYR
jgi:hypothetical protein